MPTEGYIQFEQDTIRDIMLRMRYDCSLSVLDQRCLIKLEPSRFIGTDDDTQLECWLADEEDTVLE